MQLNFSKYDFKIKIELEKQFIFDLIRKKYVALTPEEWVRQQMVHYLIFDFHFPKNLISIEKKITLNGLTKRTDLVLFNMSGLPKCIIECKSNQVKLSQTTFEQVARYNLTLQVPYLIITNGIQFYCAAIDHKTQTFLILNHLPELDEIIG